MFEAAANGSAVAGKTVLNVVVNYISFMSLLAFVDATLWWIGERVGFSGLTFGVSYNTFHGRFLLISLQNLISCKKL